MSDDKAKRRQSVLDPIERSSEVLFGLIMVLSFTGTISIARHGESDSDEIRSILIGAIGCNLAWGIVDAIMYLLNVLGARGRELKVARDVRDAKTPEEARAVIADALPDALAEALRAEDVAALAGRMRGTRLPARPSLRRGDVAAALLVFALVFVSTLPVVVPFVVMREDAWRAKRVSNGIAIAMLFLTGLSLGRYSFKRPWVVGVVMVVVGLVLVSITMALGG